MSKSTQSLSGAILSFHFLTFAGSMDGQLPDGALVCGEAASTAAFGGCWGRVGPRQGCRQLGVCALPWKLRHGQRRTGHASHPPDPVDSLCLFILVSPGNVGWWIFRRDLDQPHRVPAVLRGMLGCNGEQVRVCEGCCMDCSPLVHTDRIHHGRSVFCAWVLLGLFLAACRQHRYTSGDDVMLSCTMQACRISSPFSLSSLMHNHLDASAGCQLDLAELLPKAEEAGVRGGYLQ